MPSSTSKIYGTILFGGWYSYLFGDDVPIFGLNTIMKALFNE
jgi:hypothetical protein